jgi:hypothetical protein
VIHRQVPGQEQLRQISKGEATLTTKGWGSREAITATTPADLEPYLVDGHLKLKATISLC